MKNEIPKAYNPKETESKWYPFWEERGFFTASPHSKKPPFSMVMPPPNVTGVLHMGHALVNTLQDTLVRWKRMCGYETLWIPGTDHAGIATQTTVERNLLAREGKKRSDFGREEFINIIWEWKEKSEKIILQQIRRLGCSCDWSRLRFTMDEGCSRAVGALFKQLFDEGLIYRGDYLVNWDPLTQTALADDEVEYEERPSFLWTFKYHLADGSDYVRIATTRPETLPGDTAIAVSPHDARFLHLIGKKVRHPLTQKEIPIISDRHVDPQFGTGMVKITPAHDPNDYRIGLDNGLEFINVMTPDGRMNERAGPLAGLTREEAREAACRIMEDLRLLEKTERHPIRVGVSYRSKAVIEPYLSKQWFVKTAPFIEHLKRAVEKGKVSLHPQTWEQTYFHWIHHLRDWCISRQLWWGHRIPVWHHKHQVGRMICHAGTGLPPEVEQSPEDWQQDPDVLDTWFSSALWPLSTLGWPEATPDFKKFYPTSTLVTGHDILFFWVARMIMIGEHLTGKVPFHETFLHGLIYGKSYWRQDREGKIAYITGEEKKEYDLGKKTLSEHVFSKWEKLSKSKGNVIDPLDLIEEYGTDAMRMALCACGNQSPQIDLDRRVFEEYKNFANKIWNGSRFVFMHLEGLSANEFAKGLDDSLMRLEDQWILSRMSHVNGEINDFLTRYSFDRAAAKSYDFFWKEFCSHYLEIVKPVLFGKEGTFHDQINKKKMLVIVLCNALRLLHPMAPFITEELFQQIKKKFPSLPSAKQADPFTAAAREALLAEACMAAPFPQAINQPGLEQFEERFAFLETVIHHIRTIRAEMKIPPQMTTDLIFLGSNPMLPDHIHIITALVPTGEVHVEIPAGIGFSAAAVIGELTIMIPLPKELAEKEKVRLEKERDKLVHSIEHLRARLNNPEFLKKANPDLVSKQRLLLADTETELKLILKHLERYTHSNS